MFCNQCGHPVASSDSFCGNCGTRVATTVDDRGNVLQVIVTALSQYPQLSLIQGQKADLEISNELANANWTVGKKKVEYSACLIADPGTRTIIFWEIIKESGRGMAALFSFTTETYRTDGTTRSGTVKETGYGFGGKVIDYNWDYAQVRQTVEAAAQSQDWQFKTVLMKGKASY
jgi:hypothetical protein